MSTDRTIYVDADACPVKSEIERTAARHQTPVVMVCNGGLRPSTSPLVRMVYVDQGLDVADQWITNHVAPGDLVVTGDIPLAAEVIARGGRVVKPDGELLTDRNIGPVLATRDLMTDLRSAAPLNTGGGGRPFGKSDRARFCSVLDQELRRSAIGTTAPDPKSKPTS